jgi:hypothetical protein
MSEIPKPLCVIFTGDKIGVGREKCFDRSFSKHPPENGCGKEESLFYLTISTYTAHGICC